MKKFPCSNDPKIQCEGNQKGKKKVAHEGEPGKDKVECLIDELDVYPELAREAMRRAV
jgi:hypothetical protein